MEVGRIKGDFPPFREDSIVWLTDRKRGSYHIIDFKKIGEKYEIPIKHIEVLSPEEAREEEEKFFLPILPPVQLFGDDI